MADPGCALRFQINEYLFELLFVKDGSSPPEYETELQKPNEMISKVGNQYERSLDDLSKKDYSIGIGSAFIVVYSPYVRCFSECLRIYQNSLAFETSGDSYGYNRLFKPDRIFSDFAHLKGQPTTWFCDSIQFPKNRLHFVSPLGNTL